MNRLVYALVPIIGLLIFLWDPTSRIKGTVEAFGIFTVTRISAVEDERLGQTFVGDATPSHQTDVIPAKPATLFGYTFRVSGLDPNTTARLQTVFVHPSVQERVAAENGRLVVDLDVHVAADGTANSRIGYYLGGAPSSILGEWTLEVWYGPQKLTSKNFTLVPP